MYANPRLVALNGRVARQVHPRRGVIAGCAFATTCVKVLMVRALDMAMARMPEGVNLDAYIDDLALSTVGTRAQVIDRLTRAHKVLKEAVQEELGCELAQEKTAVVATCAQTAKQLKEAVGAHGRIFEAAPDFGTDAPAAKPRGAWSKTSLRRSRLVKATQRERRLKKLSTALGTKATRIYKTGAEKAGTYGVEIWGMADAEVKKLRKLAATTVKPRGRGRSLIWPFCSRAPPRRRRRRWRLCNITERCGEELPSGSRASSGELHWVPSTRGGMTQRVIRPSSSRWQGTMGVRGEDDMKEERNQAMGVRNR